MTGATQALQQFSFLFTQDDGYLRIPIWGHIPLSRAARRIIEHPDFVRLSRIRQLGLVHYVFPGASHTRFEHSVGAYYLSTLMLQRLVLNPINWRDTATPKITPGDACLFLAAALLHDIGHYPFAHLVDRLPASWQDRLSRITHHESRPAFDSHEDRARHYILGHRSPGSIYSILVEEWGIGDPEQVVRVIEDPENSGLPGRMLSGILDPDKMDYLMRDAWACGVPYGNIDTDRLIESLVLDVDGGTNRLGITEKGVAPLESLVFAKYMMFRHIYWHHAVRIAVAMLTRFVQDGLIAGIVEPSDFYSLSDDGLIEELSERSADIPAGKLIENLKARTLYKRGITFYPEHALAEDEFALSADEFRRVQELYYDPELRREKEMAICEFLGQKGAIDLQGFEVLLDIPRITSVFDIDDFRELRVLTTKQSTGERAFVPFNSYGFTQLTADFATQFERYSRHLQVISRPDLRDLLRQNHEEIRRILVD